MAGHFLQYFYPGSPNPLKSEKPFSKNELPKYKSWNHIPTGENPANCASCGLVGNEIENRILWWNGPSWLAQDKDKSSVLLPAVVYQYSFFRTMPQR